MSRTVTVADVQTWNSKVFGLLMWTAGIVASSFRRRTDTSSLEHWKWNRDRERESLKPSNWKKNWFCSQVRRSVLPWNQPVPRPLSVDLRACLPVTMATTVNYQGNWKATPTLPPDLFGDTWSLGQRHGDVVEAVRNGHIFHYVTSMKNICGTRRYFSTEQVENTTKS